MEKRCTNGVVWYFKINERKNRVRINGTRDGFLKERNVERISTIYNGC